MNAQPEFKKLTLHRRNDGDMVFISCDELDGFFFSAKKGWPIRAGLEKLLQLGYQNSEQKARIYINGSVSKPTIHAVIEMTEKQKHVANDGRSRIYRGG